MHPPLPAPVPPLADPFATALLADRAALWRTIARGVSHELANASQMLSLDPPTSTALGEARDRVTRSARLLATLGRSDQPTPPPSLVGDVVVALDLAQSMQTGFSGVSFEVALEPSLPALAMSSGDLEHVLLSLVTNAKQCGARRVAVRVHCESRGVAFRVMDDGPGVPATLAASIFDAGFSTRGAPHLGLGLTIARALVERWSGALASLTVDRGACFVAHVPAIYSPRPSSSPR